MRLLGNYRCSVKKKLCPLADQCVLFLQCAGGANQKDALNNLFRMLFIKQNLLHLKHAAWRAGGFVL